MLTRFEAGFLRTSYLKATLAGSRLLLLSDAELLDLWQTGEVDSDAPLVNGLT